MYSFEVVGDPKGTRFLVGSKIPGVPSPALKYMEEMNGVVKFWGSGAAEDEGNAAPAKISAEPQLPTGIVSGTGSEPSSLALIRHSSLRYSTPSTPTEHNDEDAVYNDSDKPVDRSR